MKQVTEFLGIESVFKERVRFYQISSGSHSEAFVCRIPTGGGGSDHYGDTLESWTNLHEFKNVIAVFARHIQIRQNHLGQVVGVLGEPFEK